MGRMASFLGGLLSGGAVGALLGLLFTPDSGEGMRHDLRARYQHALAEGRAAAELKRQEMEAELAHLTGAPPAGSTAATPATTRPGTPGARAS